MSLLKFAMWGLDRNVEWYEGSDRGRCLNLGAGKKILDCHESLDADNGWLAPTLDNIEDQSVSHIVAAHFFEHLDKDTVLAMLRECERVMMPGATLDILVPYYTSQMAYHDLDHKTWYTEATFKNLFECPYYDGTMPRNWKLKEVCSVLFGVAERNLALIVQIRKS